MQLLREQVKTDIGLQKKWGGEKKTRKPFKNSLKSNYLNFKSSSVKIVSFSESNFRNIRISVL